MARFLQWLLIAVCLVSVALSKPSKSKAGNKNGLKRQAGSYGGKLFNILQLFFWSLISSPIVPIMFYIPPSVNVVLISYCTLLSIIN